MVPPALKVPQALKVPPVKQVNLVTTASKEVLVLQV
jgi:hypothetical protein